MSALIDLTGQRFGRLVVIGREPTNDGRTYWSCRCDCGRDSSVLSGHLRNGLVVSCGCRRRMSRLSHGSSKEGSAGYRLYYIWKAMRRRCADVSDEFYGARGITVCEEWNDFPSFRKWAVLNGYAANLTIDRINNDLGYSPANCRWATAKEQAANRRQRRKANAAAGQ